MKRVHKPNHSDVVAVALSERDKKFMTEVGLLDDPLCHLRPLAVPRLLAPGVTQIATEGDIAPVVVLADGSVRMLDEGDGRFVNTSLPLLGAALIEYEKFYSQPGSPLEPPSRNNARRLRAALSAVDPPSLVDRESYWRVIVEQVRDGLL